MNGGVPRWLKGVGRGVGGQADTHTLQRAEGSGWRDREKKRGLTKRRRGPCREGGGCRAREVKGYCRLERWAKQRFSAPLGPVRVAVQCAVQCAVTPYSTVQFSGCLAEPVGRCSSGLEVLQGGRLMILCRSVLAREKLAGLGGFWICQG